MASYVQYVQFSGAWWLYFPSHLFFLLATNGQWSLISMLFCVSSRFLQLTLRWLSNLRSASEALMLLGMSPLQNIIQEVRAESGGFAEKNLGYIQTCHMVYALYACLKLVTKINLHHQIFAGFCWGALSNKGHKILHVYLDISWLSKHHLNRWLQRCVVSTRYTGWWLPAFGSPGKS